MEEEGPHGTMTNVVKGTRRKNLSAATEAVTLLGGVERDNSAAVDIYGPL